MRKHWIRAALAAAALAALASCMPLNPPSAADPHLRQVVHSGFEHPK